MIEPLIDPHAAVTLATPRTRAMQRTSTSISRNVVLPWPAVVLVIAVGSGVFFEHVLAGDTRSTIASVLAGRSR